MVAGILIAVSAGAFWTLSGIANSLCARYKLSIVTYLFSNVLCSFLLSVFLCVRYHALTLDSVVSLAPILIPSGILNTSGALLLQYAMKSGHHGIVFLLSQSAMIIPFLFGILLFREQPTLLQFAGGALIFAGMVCCAAPKIRFGKKAENNSSRKWLYYAIFAFLGFGLAQTLMTLPSWYGLKDAANIRTSCLYFGSTLIMSVYAGVISPGHFDFSKRLILCGIIVSVLNLISMMLMFHALDHLRAYRLSSIGFPLAIASSLVGFTLYSILILREKCYVLTLAGLLQIIAGGIFISK